MEQSDTAQPPPLKKPRSVRLAGQNCIVMFVVFLPVLFSFGQAFAGWTQGSSGRVTNFNVLSSVGIACGVYAAVFLPLRWRTIMTLSPVKKVLGLIGGFGLILHTLLAMLFPLPPLLTVGAGPGGAGGRAPMGRQGSEVWKIDGKTYQVAGTYCLKLPEGFQFTIEYPWQFGDFKNKKMDDARAIEIAFPLMKHAYEKELYKRLTITSVRRGRIAPTRIGVVLFEKADGGTRGYRVARSLDYIKKRIERMPQSQTSPVATE